MSHKITTCISSNNNLEYLKTNNIEQAIEFANKCATKVVQKPGVTII